MVNRDTQLYSGYVCSGVCYGLLVFVCDLGSKEHRKAATPNCTPQGGICKLVLWLVCFECIVFTLVELSF